jgi:hypothetical protein
VFVSVSHFYLYVMFTSKAKPVSRFDSGKEHHSVSDSERHHIIAITELITPVKICRGPSLCPTVEFWHKFTHYLEARPFHKYKQFLLHCYGKTQITKKRMSKFMPKKFYEIDSLALILKKNFF